MTLREKLERMRTYAINEDDGEKVALIDVALAAHEDRYAVDHDQTAFALDRLDRVLGEG